MSIRKALLLASMALTAIAFAAPAMAQAEATITENGVALQPGAKVTATSTNLITETALGNLECEKVTLHFEVKTNGPNHVVVEQLGEAGTEECVFESIFGPFEAVITDGTVGVGEEHKVTFNTWGTAVTNATFEVHIVGLETCHFEGNVKIQATHPDVLDVEEGSVLAGNEGCLVEEGTMHGSFTIETPGDNEELTFDYVNTGA